MARMTISGYGQVELNNVAFRRDGRIEAQCALDTTDFANVPAENGMILRVKKADHKICFADASAANQLYALNYSTEHIYDERTPGLKNFKLEAQNDFLPRVGYLAAGDLWTHHEFLRCWHPGCCCSWQLCPICWPCYPSY